MDIIIFTDINNCYGFGRDAGPYRIASELSLNDFTVQVIDFFAYLSLDDIKDIADKFTTSKTLMVMFGSTHLSPLEDLDESLKRNDRENVYERIVLNASIDCFPQSLDWMRDFVEIFRKKNNDIKFIVGGEKASSAHTEWYDGIVDYWVLGRADKSIVKLANAIKYDKPMPNIIYSDRDYKFECFNTAKINYKENDLIFEDEALPIEISRGCGFNCPFCSFTKKDVGINSEKDPEIIKEELQYNYDHFGTTSYMVMDPTPNDTVRKLEMFCNVFKSMPFDIEWSAFARLDTFYKHPEMREIFLQGGVKSVQFGIETLHDPTIKIINKGINAEKTKEMLYYIDETWNGKVITGSFFLAGLPGESVEDFYENMQWVIQSDSPLHSADVGVMGIRSFSEDIESEVSFSPIARDMDKFDYHGKRNDWENTETKMTKQLAFKAAVDISEQGFNKKKVNCYLYNRMRNVGYSFEEIYNMNKDYKYTFVEATKRKKVLFEEYMQRLANLKGE